MAGIIWLASYPKSGNTWLRAFLHNLLRNPREAYPINRLDDLVASASSRGWYDAACGRPTSSLDEDEVLRLTPAAHARMARRSQDDVFVKTHSRMGQYAGVDLSSGLLTAGAIYIIRNPFDVAVSAADHFNVSLDAMVDHMCDPDFRTAPGAAHVAEYVGDWAGHVESWAGVPHRRLLVLRYEDLLQAPRREFGRLCTFLGLRTPADRIDRAIEASSFKTLQAQERRGGFKERAPHASAFFRQGRADQWRDVFSEDLSARLGAATARSMQRFGYLVGAPPAGSDSGVEKVCQSTFSS